MGPKLLFYKSEVVLLLGAFPFSWKFDTEEPENSPANIRAFKILRGHNASVQSVAAETSGSMVFSITFVLVDTNIFVVDFRT